VEVPKMLNVPNIPNSKFPETRQWEDRGLHRILYRFSPDDYREITQIWTGSHPEDGSSLEVLDGPPEGFAPPDLPAEPQLTAPIGPDVSSEMLKDVAKRLFG
jgi:Mn-containing catalase